MTIGSRLYWQALLSVFLTVAVGGLVLASFGPWAAVGAALVVGACGAYFVVRPTVSGMAGLRRASVAGLGGDLEPTVDAGDLEGMSREVLAKLNRLEARLAGVTRDRDKLLTILSGMSEGVIAVDRDERVLHMNDAAGKILDVSALACTGKPIWEVTRVHEIPAAIKSTIDTGAKQSAEITLVRRPRDQVIVIRVAPLRDQGVTAGAVVVLEVLTELRQLEEIRRDFVANVSHELKTPITAIRGFAETLVDDREMVAEVRDRFHSKILNQALRLSALVSDLLTLARLESREGVMDAEAVDLREVVRASLQALLAAAEARDVSVEITLPEEAVVVSGDPGALNQLVTNLLDNAIKYTPPRGRVWVRVEADERFASIVVQDTGVGIEPKHQKRIFERFYRVDKARSRELGGTGLGLSIVKHICLAHGGEVTLDSAAGRGTTFNVRLPRVDSERS